MEAQSQLPPFSMYIKIKQKISTNLKIKFKHVCTVAAILRAVPEAVEGLLSDQVMLLRVSSQSWKLSVA
jgi:hypothetical protein